jgi:hypothetical protein
LLVVSPEAGGTITLKLMVPRGVAVDDTTKFWPEPCTLIHQVPLSEIAQGLMKVASVTVAGTDPSEIRLVTLYAPPVCAAVWRGRIAAHSAKAANIPALALVVWRDFNT